MENEVDLVQPSKYYDDQNFKIELNIINNRLCLLSLNCQSINAKYKKLKMCLDDVNAQHLISVICIQESLAHEEMDMKYFSLPNYSLINANRRLNLHGGLIIYIHDDFAYTEISDSIPISKTSTLFESLFIEIWKKTMSSEVLLIGNLYRLPL